MTKDQIINRLEECHRLELSYNIEMRHNRKQIGELTTRNNKLAELISKNMKYRNQIIGKL